MSLSDWVYDRSPKRIQDWMDSRGLGPADEQLYDHRDRKYALEHSPEFDRQVRQKIADKHYNTAPKEIQRVIEQGRQTRSGERTGEREKEQERER